MFITSKVSNIIYSFNKIPEKKTDLSNIISMNWRETHLKAP